MRGLMPASRLAGHPTGISFAYVFMRVWKFYSRAFSAAHRSSPSQLMNRQSPRYAINRLGNRGENRSTAIDPN
jgi:hypothetical protein